MERCDVAIVGAGPYGLSAAAHLCQVKGLDIRLFGEPMSFWERHMPERMFLRSPWDASHISDPDDRLTLDRYRDDDERSQSRSPLGVGDFIAYGRWFYQQVGVPAERNTVLRIDRTGPEYRLVLERGADVRARRVVIAGGQQSFVHRPAVFDDVPRSLATHTSEHRDFRRFRGKHVCVIGSGTSAVEAAGFLCDAGARVEVLMRGPVLRWPRQWTHAKPLGWMLYGRGDVGPAGVSLIVQRPDLFRRLPRWVQTWWGRRAIRPSVLPRLKPSVAAVPIHTRRWVLEAREDGERVHLWLNDGTQRVVDHVVLGTGYRVNVARYPFMSADVLDRTALVRGYPLLDAGFETSLPALHFLGAPAAWSFGPLMRFVAGTEFSSRALARRVAAVRHPRLVFGADVKQSERPGHLASQVGRHMTTVRARAAPQNGAIVLAEHIRGLGVVRSLGRRGIPVWTLAPAGDLLSSVSRYTSKRLAWPHGDEADQLEYLRALADRHHLDGWTLFSTTDETTAFCARHCAELSAHFRLTVAPWDVLRWAYDKRLTHRLAAQAGIDQPLTLFRIRPEDLSALPLSFPVVLKPAFKKEVNRFTHDKAWRADNPQALATLYNDACTLVGPDVVMVQELIPGGGDTQFSYAALCADGQTVASVTARRTRQYPVDFGHSSSFVETIDEPGVEEPARRVLAAMRYTGLAEVEFKYDRRDGRYKLLEVNPRPWTWHALCGRAGVDFPYLLWLASHGARIPQLRGRAGVKWVRMSTDLVAACGEMRRRQLTLSAYLRSLGAPIESATFAADDPLPGLLDFLGAVYSRFTRSPILTNSSPAPWQPGPSTLPTAGASTRHSPEAS